MDKIGSFIEDQYPWRSGPFVTGGQDRNGENRKQQDFRYGKNGIKAKDI